MLLERRARDPRHSQPIDLTRRDAVAHCSGGMPSSATTKGSRHRYPTTAWRLSLIADLHGAKRRSEERRVALITIRSPRPPSAGGSVPSRRRHPGRRSQVCWHHRHTQWRAYAMRAKPRAAADLLGLMTAAAAARRRRDPRQLGVERVDRGTRLNQPAARYGVGVQACRCGLSSTAAGHRRESWVRLGADRRERRPRPLRPRLSSAARHITVRTMLGPTNLRQLIVGNVF